MTTRKNTHNREFTIPRRRIQCQPKIPNLWARQILLSILLLASIPSITAETVLIDNVYYDLNYSEQEGTAIAEKLQTKKGYIYIPDFVESQSKRYRVIGCYPNIFSDFDGTLVLNGDIEPMTKSPSQKPNNQSYFSFFKGTLILKGNVSSSLAEHFIEIHWIGDLKKIMCETESMEEVKKYWKGKIELIPPVYIGKINTSYTSTSFYIETQNPDIEYSVWFEGNRLTPYNGQYTITGLLPDSKHIICLKFTTANGGVTEICFDINTLRSDDDCHLASYTPNCCSIKFEFKIPKDYLDIGASAGIIIGTEPYFNEEGYHHDSITVPIEKSHVQYRDNYYYAYVIVKDLCPRTKYYYQPIITNGKYTNYISHNGREIETSSPNLEPIYKQRTQRTFELSGVRTDSTDIALGEWNISILRTEDTKAPLIGYKKSGLKAGYREWVSLLFEKGDKQFNEAVLITTEGLIFDITLKNLSPSSAEISVDYNQGDAVNCIRKIEILFDGEIINKKEAIFTGLIPEGTYDTSFIAEIYYGKDFGKTTEYGHISFTTPKLEIKCEVPRNVNPTTSILAAQTNLADCETGVGFEWKKYDAPASLAPSSGYGILYDGRLEGRVLNLQSDKYYNCRAFYEDADKDRYYSDWVTFDPSDFSYFDPVIHSYDVSEITATSACLNGMMMPGSDEVLSQGFEIRRADSGKTVSLYSRMSDIVETIFTQGLRFKATAANLEPSTTYICRSFVKTSRETYYGEEVTFTTIAPTSGIEDVNMTEPEREIVAYYNLQGYRIEKPSTGIVIVKYSDGSTSKILIKD